jgi:hypothetical protein
MQALAGFGVGNQCLNAEGAVFFVSQLPWAAYMRSPARAANHSFNTCTRGPTQALNPAPLCSLAESPAWTEQPMLVRWIMDEHTSDSTTKSGAIETPTRPGDEIADPRIRKLEVCDGEGNVFGTTDLLVLDPEDPAVICVTVTEANHPPVTVCVEIDGASGPAPGAVFVTCAEREVVAMNVRPGAQNESDVPF